MYIIPWILSFLASCYIFAKYCYLPLKTASSNSFLNYVSPKRFYYYFLFILSITCLVVSILIFHEETQTIAFFLILYWALYAFLFFQGFSMIKSYIIKIIEHCVGVNFLIFSLISSLVIILIFYSIFTNAFTFLKEIGISNFLFKTNWQPEGYLSDPKNSFGIIPLIINTLYITFFSLIVSFLFGMLAAIYLAEYTKSKQVRFLLKSSFEIVAGIPSIFYGFFGAFILAPALVKFGRSIGVYISMESILIPGIAIGVMMTPYVATLLDDAFSSIPKTLKDASTAMGVTKYETIKYLILPIALPEIISTLIIVISRVLGETMVVLLTCGIISLMTLNPLLPSTTITVQIVYLLTGDTSFDSVKTLSVFGLSLFLFVSTMLLNIISLKVKSKNKQL